MGLGPNGRVAFFVMASILSHSALSAVLPAHVPTRPPLEPETVTFAVLLNEPGVEPEPVLPEPEPVLPEPEPEPEPVRPPRPAREPTEPPSIAEEALAEEPPTEEPPGDPDASPEADDPQGEPQATEGLAAADGLNVGLPVGGGNDGASRGTLRRGRAGLPTRPARTADRRALVQAYLRQVQRALGAPTQTRALRRAGLEGVVMVALRIDPEGKVRGVRVRTPSGMPLLDEAALEHVRRFAQVPPPPVELAWVTREITLPVRYETRRRR